MFRISQAIIMFSLLVLSIATAQAEAQTEKAVAESLHWQVGPTVGSIGKKATITVPDGYLFLDAADTKKFMSLIHNISGDNEYLFAPRNLKWYAVFEFDPVGYVKDNETLDSKALLDSVTTNTELANVERQKRGWSTMSILGWRFKPRYDKQNHLLEWAFLAKDDSTGGQIINYNTRLLGRSGVMSVVLVADPDTLDTSVASFKREIQGYNFTPGERYAEYREGDKVAKFGLAALIAGGAAAVATKKGFWAALVGLFLAAKKIVIAAAIGLFAWLRSFLRRDK